MGQVYYDMGFLSSPEVIECSASDLVGQYVGHTGPKTRKLFERALGKVLFVDEAYRLGSQGRFAQEAVDELVGLLTHEDFNGKIVVVLAGYDTDMDQLMTVNTGLASRFTEEIVFGNFSPERCLDILEMQLKKEQIAAPELDEPSSAAAQQLVSIFKQLCRLPSWGNARDVITLAKSIIRKTINADAGSAGEPLTLHWADALVCARDMLRDKRARLPKQAGQSWLDDGADDQPTLDASSAPPLPPPPPAVNSNAASSGPPPPPPPSSSNKDASSNSPPPAGPKSSSPVPLASAQQYNPSPFAPDPDQRDPGVSDAVWNQLQADKQAQADDARRAHEKEVQLAAELADARKREQEERRRAIALQRKAAADATAARELEAQRQRKIAAEKERQRIWQAQQDAKRREEEKRKREEQAQRKLREMGVCVMGYQWIPQGGGYRCAGGSHYVSNGQLGL
jgi:SpoVK/Ycf46/Vps4 family AAA+-type ATPase